MAKTSISGVISNKKHMGPEPEFAGKTDYLSETEMARAYAWYNYIKDNDAAKTYLTEYAKTKGIKIAVSRHTTNTFGWVARLLSRGAKLRPDVVERLDKYLNKIKKTKAEEEEIDDETVVQKPVKVEKPVNRIGEWLPDFEIGVDLYKDAFNPYQYIVNNNIPQMYVRQIADYYQPQLDEVAAACDKTDKDIVEAYKPYSRADLKALRLRLQTIVEDCEKYLGNVKKERKPRKKKTKSAEAILKHFKYLAHHNESKLSSEDPSKILGSNAVYVWNTKYNTLTMFVAKDENGLTVNRTAIDNYDPKLSKAKRIGRKAEAIVKAVLEGTKRSRLKVLDGVKADDLKFTDRLNEYSLILKVDK